MTRRLPTPPPSMSAARMRIGDEDVVVFSWSVTRSTLPADVVLTDAERAVGELLLDGCSDADISRARGTSVRTVGKQVASLYRKLGVGSRRELWALCGAQSDPTSAPDGAHEE